MNTLKRKNHYVPRLYLSHWANNGELFEYSLIVQHPNVPIWNRRPICSVASQKNLYIYADNGIESDFIETDFDSRFENPAKEPIDKLCTNGSLNTREWETICDYVLAQFVRTPAYYFWVHDLCSTIIPGLLDSIGTKIQNKEYLNATAYQSSSRIPFPMKISIEGSGSDAREKQLRMAVINGKGLWLHTIQEDIQTGSPFWSFFRSLKWSVVSSVNNVLWPACDNPVIPCEMYGNILYRIHPSSGIQGREKVILFPISPQIALIGVQGKPLPIHLNASTFLSKGIKLAIIQNALMYIYSTIEDPDIPSIRPRTVDIVEYNRIMRDLKQWHNSYMSTEGNYNMNTSGKT